MPADPLTLPPDSQHVIDWPQLNIEFTDPQTAERVAAERLWPPLVAAQVDGVITGWWFIRKRPCWRLRYPPGHSDARQHLARILDDAVASGQIVGWTTGIYEPEVVAFGGPDGMAAAHELFHLDSRHILTHLARPTITSRPASLGRRELGIVLCSALMRGAGQDLYEQGDVWSRVATHRPDAYSAFTADRRAVLTSAMHRLMTVDPSGGLLNVDPGWFTAFTRAGQQLADLARRGTLGRGLRAVLTHHVIFAWNRLGLPAADQGTLARLAKEVVMAEPERGAVSATNPPTDGARVGAVKTDATATTSQANPEHLRSALADALRKLGTVRTDRVHAAIRAVPRHVFLSGVTVAQAYADEPVYTKRTPDGATKISAASQPTIVAMMLEQLGVEPGQRTLEIGAGTGYNAAVLAHLVGPDGSVVTIDVDDDIVDGARSGLAAAGYDNVRVILGDGALGFPDGAPYDRVIAAVGAFDLPPAWLDQLAPHGRLLVPLRLRGSVSRAIAFERADGYWRSRSSEMCSFMPLRDGAANDPQRSVALTSDGAVTFQAHQEQTVDAVALADVLTRPRSEVWTGTMFAGPESQEWLYLWLACTLDGALSRMEIQRSAIDSDLVKPAFGWGTMATTSNGNLAYLTLRPIETVNRRLYEIGVIGHGPTGDELASRVARETRTWDQEHRSQTVQFDIQPAAASPEITGQFVFTTTHNRLAITWR